MILYGSYTSPYVRHIRTALSQFNFNFEFVDTDYAASASGSPVKRVPFLDAGDTKLTDSSSILLYLKQLSGQAGFDDVQDFELYTLVNSAMDAEINLFLLSRDGLTPDNSDYLSRQKSRIASSLKYLNNLIENQIVDMNNLSDGQLRLACFLDWGLFRQRFSLDGLDSLMGFLDGVRLIEEFAATKPPM
jgi:glutathione S-transferase